MASADDIARSIEPGSLPYGERAPLADTLQSALGGGGGGAQQLGPAPAPEGLAGGPPAEIDPLERLMSGDHSSDLPITEGMPFGPGGGGPDSVPELPEIERARLIAMHAKSPVLRYLARNALRRHYRSGR